MTGLIYVILISLWGVVLVPRWLRHHDESRRRREAERLERALNPHTSPAFAPDAGQDERYGSWGEYLRSLTRLDSGSWESARWLDSLRSPRGRHARRRRTIVLALGAATVIGMVGAVVGAVPGFVAVLLTLLLGGYISAMILHLRQSESARRSVPAPQAPHMPVTVPAGAGAGVAVPATEGVRLVRGSAAVGAEWDPRETTLPMYAGKAKASKIPRRIDLTSNGWTGADMVQQARAQQASPELQQQFDREFAALEPDLDEQVGPYANPGEADSGGEYRRAANQ